MTKATLFLLSLFALILSYPARGAAEEYNTKNLTLEECVQIALQNSTSGIKAERALKLSGSDVLRNYGKFLPHVSASSSYSPATMQRGWSTTSGGYTKTKTESASLALTATLNLFNGLSDYASLKAALSEKKSARHTLARAYETIAYDITQSYYQALLEGELMLIAREDLRSSRDQLKLTGRQFEVGLKSMTDLYQQQAETASRELVLIQAESRARRSTLELLRRLQIDPESTIGLADPPALGTDLPVNSADSLTARALRNRRDLKASERNARALKWKVTSARGARWPSLDASFSVGTGGTSYLIYDSPTIQEQLENSGNYAVSLNLNWSIFDGFQTGYTVQAAKISHLNSMQDYDDLQRTIQIDIQQQLGDYNSARTEIITAETSLKAAEAAWNAVRRKYELGAAGFVDLSAARSTLFEARSSLTRAKYNLALQKNILDYTTGSIPLPPVQ
ncbi:TolC family protein [Chlorobium phaeovibrioides]|uniref:TolC family protein n=1 Tax=Chlorobium phaeovibrioides TaxID=1094 RepID=UPI000F844D98|nr:TolC family protein [Chlorobium phaeovibrioides]RTY34507.1 TolC family protein [Chlorobium phaeovibrioides]